LGLAEIFRFVFGVEVEKQDAGVISDPVVDDASAASFPVAFGRLAKFAAATGTGNDIAGVGLLHQIHLDCEDPIIADQAKCFYGEIWIFFKGHGDILRMIFQQSRSY